MTIDDETAPEYGWKSAEAAHSHSCLLPVIDDAIKLAIGRNGMQANNLSIFDAGCGNGYLAGYLRAQGHTVAGCDASREGIKHARQAYPDIRFEDLSIYEKLFEQFGDDWDIVVSSEVVEHLYDPRKFTKNVYDLLRPGGAFVVTTPYHGYLKNLVMAVAGKMDNHFTALWDGGHIKFWSVNTLSVLLTEAGFREISFSGAGRLPWLWKSMVLTATK